MAALPDIFLIVSVAWVTRQFDWRLQSFYVFRRVPNMTDAELSGRRGREKKGHGIKQKTKYPLHDNTPLSSTPSPSSQLLISSLFHHLSISVIPLFFSSTKSVLIANHHKPAKWQIILHSFITKPPSSYFVSQHVQRVQLPCLLIQSASQRKPRQIMPEDGGNSPPQPEMDHNIPYFSYLTHLHTFKTWCSQPSRSHSTSSLILTSC